MTTLARLTLLLAVALPLAVAPEAGSVPGAPTPHCSPSPDSCSGWFTGNVTVSWAYDAAGATQTTGCNVRTITTDGTFTQSCEVAYGDSSFARSVTIRRDATPPQVTGALFERAPDSAGWYNHAVALVLSGSDTTSGLASCDRPTYGGPDGPSVRVAGVCRDLAGNTSASASAALRYDASAPAVTAATDRAPDRDGWYRRPLTVRFSGADAVSGVDSCAAPVRYAGPDRPDIAVAGTCRDAAGNVSTPVTVTIRYDATPPRLRGLTARVIRGVARVGWQKPSDAVGVRIERIPGVNGAERTHVYSGTGERFLDRTVRQGVRYRYEVSVSDAAGNVSEAAVAAGTQAALYAPAPSAVVRAPVSLRWLAVRKARYYNVQLHRNGIKILSAWPRGARLRVVGSWRYLGRRQSLLPGTYSWYVWPGLGAPELRRYGRLLGTSRFRVKRQAPSR